MHYFVYRVIMIILGFSILGEKKNVHILNEILLACSSLASKQASQ